MLREPCCAIVSEAQLDSVRVKLGYQLNDIEHTNACINRIAIGTKSLFVPSLPNEFRLLRSDGESQLATGI